MQYVTNNVEYPVDIRFYKTGYSRRSDLDGMYRQMLVFEAKTLTYGQEIPFEDKEGRVRLCRVTGKVKTWKREPHRVEIPMKYGMYESFHVTAIGLGPNVPVFPLLVKVEEE